MSKSEERERVQRMIESDLMAERRAQNPFARSSSVPPRAQTPRSTSSRSSRSSSTPRRRRNEFAGMTKLEVMAERRRRAAAAQRYGPTPGPGSYTPQQVESTTRAFAGSAAFRSTSGSSFQSASSLHEMGDPGAYTVTSKTLANDLTQTSFSTSERAGKYGFGSLTKRFNFVVRDGPGPIYDTRFDWLDEASRGRTSSGFSSGTERGTWLNKGFHVDHQYDLERSYKFLEKSGSGGSMFRNGAQRFRSTFTVSPGPAAHVPNNHTFARMLIERKRDARMSTSARDDLFRPPRVRTVVRV